MEKKEFVQEGLFNHLLSHNADSLTREINWFARVVNKRLQSYFPEEKQEKKSAP